jgi:hypothetical protein
MALRGLAGWWLTVGDAVCRSTLARRRTKGRTNFSHGRTMTRSCSCTARPRSIVSSDIRHTVRARVPVSPSDRDMAVFAHYPSSVLRGPSRITLLALWLRTHRLLTTFLRPLTTLDETTRVVCPVLHSCLLAFSRHLCSPRLYFTCLFVPIFIFVSRPAHGVFLHSRFLLVSYAEL